ncbi:MAG: hypothetical protein JNN03_21105 [Rubrivivax sp.]|nr:hypothetical protein [Rubrivivax sp.]
MDLLDLPTGLALLALVGAAGVVAWKRNRLQATLRRDVGAAGGSPRSAPLLLQAEGVVAHQAAANAVIEQARAHAVAPVAPAGAASAPNAAPVAAPAQGPNPTLSTTVPTPTPTPSPSPQFEGTAWAPTEPMPGIDLEPQFADTMPAEMGFAPTNFADTLVAELAVEERPSRVPDTRRRGA